MLSGSQLLEFAKQNADTLSNIAHQETTGEMILYLKDRRVSFNKVSVEQAEELKLFLLRKGGVNISAAEYGGDNIASHWDGYNVARAQAEIAAGKHMQPEKPRLFPGVSTKLLQSPNHRMIDIGCSTGKQHVTSVKAGIDVIGYDNNQLALISMQEYGVKGRDVNLNECDKDKLHYEKQLINDLNVPCDIFLVEIAEFMNTDALILLMYTLIDNAKPGSIFYYKGKTFHPDSPVRPVGGFQKRRDGYIPSFFGARTDFETVYHAVGITTIQGRDITMERLITRKTK